NLVPGDTNGKKDVFVRDRVARTTERISVSANDQEGNKASNEPSISADGRYVVFESYADNLVPGDTNGKSDVFVRDRVMKSTELVSVSLTGSTGNQDSYSSRSTAISADGRYVAFESKADNLVPGD